PQGPSVSLNQMHTFKIIPPELESSEHLSYGERSCPVKCVNGGSLREEARLRAQASRTKAASVSDRVTASLAIDCMLRYRRCTRHSSSCSCRTAPISRRAAAALGKMPTTS